MVVRKRRKKNKLRGNRTHGKGNTKNKRGKGVKGGRGRAGSKKHKRNYYTFDEKYKLKPIKKENTITLEKINDLVENKKLPEKDGFFVFDGNEQNTEKVLGRGSLIYKVLFKNVKMSERTKEKITSSGGKVE